MSGASTQLHFSQHFPKFWQSVDIDILTKFVVLVMFFLAFIGHSSTDFFFSPKASLAASFDILVIDCGQREKPACFF